LLKDIRLCIRQNKGQATEMLREKEEVFRRHALLRHAADSDAWRTHTNWKQEETYVLKLNR